MQRQNVVQWKESGWLFLWNDLRILRSAVASNDREVGETVSIHVCR